MRGSTGVCIFEGILNAEGYVGILALSRYMCGQVSLCGEAQGCVFLKEF